MAQTSPTAVDALPTAPQTTDGSALFATRADAFVAALATFRTQINNIATNVYNNAVDAYNSAVAAAASVVSAAAHVATALIYRDAAASSAATAAAAAGAPLWVSGTTYAIGNVAWSPLSAMVYRRITAGSGTTDPSLDPTNWLPVAYPSPTLITVTGTTVTAEKQNHYILTNVAATTVTLPASPTAGDTLWITPANGLYTNVIARNSLKIMSLSEDLTVDNPHVTLGLRYINSTIGWRIV